MIVGLYTDSPTGTDSSDWLATSWNAGGLEAEIAVSGMSRKSIGSNASSPDNDNAGGGAGGADSPTGTDSSDWLATSWNAGGLEAEIAVSGMSRKSIGSNASSPDNDNAGGGAGGADCMEVEARLRRCCRISWIRYGVGSAGRTRPSPRRRHLSQLRQRVLAVLGAAPIDGVGDSLIG
ncbi:hypothetical protein PD885_04125 (plasmid) [Xanthomonas fragariae]|uniref:Uncharacterized protein n=1 Tax=Xanthomonas fragariae TaxID=48664 RepID=A0ABY1RVE8_9XANT|nr:hypothetical protein PD885_04125 [Xanthomonas fragariae]